MQKLVLLDTNLLVLFIVGGTDMKYIQLHKNTSKFSEKDYSRLLFHISAVSGFVTTSQILSETANLLRQIKDPIKTELSTFLKVFISKAIEVRPSSLDASNDDTYLWLGLNDASILTCLTDDRVFITDDGNLHNAALVRSTNVLHFSQLEASI